MINIPDIHLSGNGVTINVNMQKLTADLNKAQYLLDSQIMTDCLPYMPVLTGQFKAATIAESQSLAGTGIVCVAAPWVYGAFLYRGVRYVNSKTGKGARPIKLPTGEIKFRYPLGAHLVPTNIPLTYTNPQAKAKWFEVAKEAHETQWVELVKKTVGAR
jgi:hypothetical protein